MAETLGTIEPAGFVIGDSVRWRKRIEVYGDHKDPADSWTLNYYLVNGGAKYTIASTDNGDGDFLVAATAAETALFAPGVYDWRAVVALAGDRFTVGSGTVCAEPNLVTSDAADLRSWAVRMLAAVEALLEGKASRDQASYSIAGRSLSRYSPAEWMDLRRKLQAEVFNQSAATDLAAGRGSRRVTRVRL